MSDSEKAFDPTPQRLERAKREGDVARSSELGANAAFGAATLATVAIVPWLGASARAAISAAATQHGPAPAIAAGVIAGALVPLACAAVAAACASVAQAGGLRVAAVSLRLERLNPSEGLKRIASRETFAHALRAAAAFTIASAAMLSAMTEAAARLIAAPPVAAGGVAWHAAAQVAFAAVATGTVFAVAEFAAARGVWLRKLRMSFDERKRETKEQEGDPFARGRRRALHRSLSRGAVAEVKKAAFVVVNPHHVAVALAYAPPKIAVPLVLVRAAGESALMVRSEACACGVPVIENVTLARALYRDSCVGSPIVAAHYVAVAEIVVALQRRNDA